MLRFKVSLTGRAVLALVLLPVSFAYSNDPVGGFRINLALPNDVERVLGLRADFSDGEGSWVLRGSSIMEGPGSSGFFAVIDAEGVVRESAILPNEEQSDTFLLREGGSGNVAGWSLSQDGRQLDFGSFDSDSLQERYRSRMSVEGMGRILLLPEANSGALAVVEENMQLYMVKFDQVGDIDWSRQIDSMDFNKEGQGQLGALEVFTVPSGYILALIQTELAIVGDDFGALNTAYIIRFDKAGQMLWSQKSQTENMFPLLDIDSFGNLFIYAIKEEEGTTIHTQVIKIDAGGNRTWSSIIEGRACKFVCSLDSGKTLLSSQSKDRNASEYVLLDDSGMPENGVRALYASDDDAVAFVDGGRIWLHFDSYNLMDADIASRRSSVVGWLSEDLSESGWIRYMRKTMFSELASGGSEGSLLFAAVLDDGNSIDCVEIDRNFDGGSVGGLFEGAEIAVSDISVDGAPLEWLLVPFGTSIENAELSVKASDLSPTAFEVTGHTIAENFAHRVPIEVVERAARVVNGSLVVQQPTTVGSEYLVETSESLRPDTWFEVARLVGTGYQEFFVQEIREGGDHAFIRITETHYD